MLWLALSAIGAMQAPRAPTNVTIVAPSPFAPGLTLLSPSSGIVGATVTITGTNMGASQGVATVTFNGTTATASAWTATSLTVTVPVGTTTGSVVVTRGSLVSNSLTFTVTTGSVANPIAAVRVPSNSQTAPDAVWALAGVEGGIPSGSWTQSGSTIAAYTGTAATINSAIAACGTNQYVLLGTGTFTLSTGVIFAKSNCVLRGAGANLTKLIINSDNSRCHLLQAGAVSFCAASANIGVDSPDNTATWSAGYSQGTTVVTLSSTANMVAGSTVLFLDQLDDTTDFPGSGDLNVCSSGGTTCAAQGGGGLYARTGRTLTTLHKVTAFNAGTGAVTIDPPIYVPNFRAGKTPGAWWGNTGNIIRNAGIEDLSVDWTGAGATPGLQLVNAYNVWVKGTRWVFFAPALTDVFHNMIVNCFRCTIESNYYYGPDNPPQIRNYQIAPHVSGSMLVQNNIQEHIVSGWVPNGPTTATVYAYNFGVDSIYTGACIIEHGFTMMNLYEGNNCLGGRADIIHAPHYFITFFRNHFDGHKNSGSGNENAIFQLETKSRFLNIVGNVLGDTGYITTYGSDQAFSDVTVYETGWKGSASGSDPGNDANVKTRLFRFGNWDTVTNATRWCGQSGNTGWATTCASTTEVPSTLPNYPNAIPSTETLPTSLYLSAKPAWFQSLTWPPIGPDVTTGTIAGYASHAFKIPARVCYESLADDPAYSGTTVRVFNRVTCYGT